MWRHPDDQAAPLQGPLATGRNSRSCSSGAASTASSSPTCSAPTTSTAARPMPRIEHGVAGAGQRPDPLLVVSAMAAVTEHLGFGVTAGTAFEHPYPFARRMSTLDHLTKGRVGWNVVTGLPAERRAQHGPRATSSSTTPATTSPTSTSRCSTSCGRARGRTTPSCATARPACSPTPTKVHAHRARAARTTRCRASTSSSRRRSARR